jgi:PAS domain S-box-containing protein
MSQLDAGLAEFTADIWPVLVRSQLPNSEPADALVRSSRLLDALPAALYVTDAAGRIVYFNEAAATLWGCRPRLHNDQWCGFWRLYWPDGTLLPHDQCPMAMALKEGKPNRGREAVAERPDGTRVPFMAFPTPFHDDAGILIGAINMLVDMSEHQRAERVSRHLVAIVESSDDAIISKDLNGLIATWNKAAERMFGYAEEEVIGKPITILIPPERLQEEVDILDRVRRGERISRRNAGVRTAA